MPSSPARSLSRRASVSASTCNPSSVWTRRTRWTPPRRSRPSRMVSPRGPQHAHRDSHHDQHREHPPPKLLLHRCPCLLLPPDVPDQPDRAFARRPVAVYRRGCGVRNGGPVETRDRRGVPGPAARMARPRGEVGHTGPYGPRRVRGEAPSKQLDPETDGQRGDVLAGNGDSAPPTTRTRRAAGPPGGWRQPRGARPRRPTRRPRGPPARRGRAGAGVDRRWCWEWSSDAAGAGPTSAACRPPGFAAAGGSSAVGSEPRSATTVARITRRRIGPIIPRGPGRSPRPPSRLCRAWWSVFLRARGGG